MFPTGSLLLTLANGVVAAPSASLAGDAVEVPWSGRARRHGEPPVGPVIVFLNFDGQTLTCENDFAHSNHSFLACAPSSLSDIPPFNAAGYPCGSIAGCKETIRSMLGALWSERWNIRFVTERPDQPDYEMAMIGGTYMPGVLGISPLDCSNANRNTVSFSFSNDAAGLPNPESALVTTISHELSHALGQCHNDNMASILYPAVDASGGTGQGWECGAVVDGCPCPGPEATCPPDYFDEILGPAAPDTQAPAVHVLAPLSGLSVPSQFNVRAVVRDDRTMGSVGIRVDGREAGSSDPLVSGLYDFRLPALPAGHARVCVVGRDLRGNEGQDCVNVTVDPSAVCVPGDCCCGSTCCEDSDTCDCAGRLPNGEPCELDQDCRGGLCEDSPWDEESRGFCTESCADDGECAAGEACMGRESSGRGQCWSYVDGAGVGRPCGVATDCPEGLSCVFPDGCTEIPPEDGVGDGPCAGAGFCSRSCGRQDPSCPERFVCSGVGDGHYCRFVGVAADVGGGCGVARSRASPWGPLALLLGLFVLRRRRP